MDLSKIIKILKEKNCRYPIFWKNMTMDKKINYCYLKKVIIV